MKCKKCGCEERYVFRCASSIDVAEHWEVVCVDCGEVIERKPLSFVENEVENG